jgi:ferredoxin/flavodoxin
MVFYFSATGNSQYAADRIAGELKDRTISIGAALRDRRFEYDISGDEYLVFVVPTFAWTLPGAVGEFIESMVLKGYGNQKVYGVFTCGESSGGECAALAAMLQGKSIGFNGSFDLVMPDNFIIWSSLPPKQTLDKILSAADSRLEDIIEAIKSKSQGKIDTNQPRDLFMPIAEISTSKGTSKLYYTEACTSCGLCQKLCPMSCITGDNEGHPVWEGRCTMCLACLHNCPSRAIEHGQDTKGKERYINPKVTLRLENKY